MRKKTFQMTVRRLPLLQEPLLVRISALGARNISLSSFTFLPPWHAFHCTFSPFPVRGCEHVHKTTQSEGRSRRRRLWTGAKSCGPYETLIALQSLTLNIVNVKISFSLPGEKVIVGKCCSRKGFGQVLCFFFFF